MKPTVADAWAWLKASMKHVEECNDENCEWYWAYVKFMETRKE